MPFPAFLSPYTYIMLKSYKNVIILYKKEIPINGNFLYSLLEVCI